MFLITCLFQIEQENVEMNETDISDKLSIESSKISLANSSYLDEYIKIDKCVDVSNIDTEHLEDIFQGHYFD